MKHLLLQMVLLILLLCNALAQDSTATALPVDSSSVVDIRLASPDDINAYSDDPDFNYETDIVSGPTLLQRTLFWLFEKLDLIFGNTIGGIFLRVFFILIFIGVIILLINQFLQGNFSSAFSGKSASKKVGLNLESEHIEVVNLDALIEEALRKKDFKEAVRYTYHKALQLLNENEIIQWSYDKTNHEYLSEIGAHPVAAPFNRLTTIYDYVEYGDFSIDAKGFSRVNEVYNSFEQKLRGRG